MSFSSPIHLSDPHAIKDEHLLPSRAQARGKDHNIRSRIDVSSSSGILRGLPLMLLP